jgi:hypothetical protein
MAATAARSLIASLSIEKTNFTLGLSSRRAGPTRGPVVSSFAVTGKFLRVGD